MPPATATAIQTSSEPTKVGTVVSLQPSATPDDCTSISAYDFDFLDSAHGWALLTTGSELKRELTLRVTADGGQTWREESVPTPKLTGCSETQFLWLRFATPSDGWIFGRVLLETHDGGRTWSDAQRDVRDLEVKEHSVWTLERSCPPPGSCQMVRRISTDWGRTWQTPVKLPGDIAWPERFAILQHFVLASAKDAWLVALAGGGGISTHLFVTHDGGLSWGEAPAPCPGYATLSAPDPQHLWLACFGIPATIMQDKWVYTSDDGGKHWAIKAEACASYTCRSRNIPDIGHVGAFVATSSQRAFLALGRWTLFATSDGGMTWAEAIAQEKSRGPDSGHFIYDVKFVDEQRGWAVGTQTLYRTTDGGAHWEALALPQ
jgi:photosystem II stability/assembly factor-like uncharacterized protein